MKSIAAAILSSGTEILQGHYPDTNAQRFSERLTALGIVVRRHIAAPDSADDLADALAYLVERHDLVLMTGGLGPTEDDLTRQAVCSVFQTELVEDTKAWDMIVQRFAMRGAPPPAANRVQALVPVGARTLYNKWGTAPGFVLEFERGAKGNISGTARGPTWLPGRCRFFAALPGPPRENRPMFEEYLERDIARSFGGGAITRISTLHTFGISESALNDLLAPLFWEYRPRPDVSLAFLAGEARVDVRVVVRGDKKNEVTRETRRILEKIRRRIPENCVYGKDLETLESVTSALLRAKGLRLAVAESCTGGLIAKRLTDLPGSSDVFLESWVTYSNAAKEKRLGVSPEILNRCGAVSAETARAMAVGALRESCADIAVAVTGIAGPRGGTAEKPVGLVWYGLAWKDSSSKIRTGTARRKIRAEIVSSCFSSGRDMVRHYAAHRALDLVRRLLLGVPLASPNDPSRTLETDMRPNPKRGRNKTAD